MSAVSWAPQYQNGALPLSILTDYDGRGNYLHPRAAETLHQLSNAYQARWGTAITVSEAFRTLDMQWYYWNLYQSGRGNVAAVPGTSTHGMALAVDINSWVYGNSSGTAQHAWLRANAPSYGWSWDLVGRPSGEPWHWNYVGPLGSSTAGGGSTSIDGEFHIMNDDDARKVETIVRDQTQAKWDAVWLPAVKAAITAGMNEAVRQVNQSLTTISDGIKSAVRREVRARLVYDSGDKGQYTDKTALRAIAVSITSGFIYTLHPDPNYRQGQVASLRSTPYQLIASDENWVGLPTAQFNNLLEMANGHARRLGYAGAFQVIEALVAAGVISSEDEAAALASLANVTQVSVPAGVDPTRVLPQVPTAKA